MDLKLLPLSLQVILDLGKISFVNAPALQRQKSESIGHGSVHTESGDEGIFKNFIKGQRLGLYD